CWSCTAMGSAGAALSVLFFFSSRRRHTRFSRDWSSDVCSSDLPFGSAYAGTPTVERPGDFKEVIREVLQYTNGKVRIIVPSRLKIGRASCRERVLILAVRVFLKRKERDKRKTGRDQHAVVGHID